MWKKDAHPASIILETCETDRAEHEVRSDVITSQDLELLLRSERCTAHVRRFLAKIYPCSKIMLWWDKHQFIHGFFSLTLFICFYIILNIFGVTHVPFERREY